MMKRFSATYLLLGLLLILPARAYCTEVKGDTSRYLRKDVLETIFSGDELMHFTLSWSGGMKIGDLYLHVQRVKKGRRAVIRAKVKDYGLFELFYPVDDTFTTIVYDPLMLPLRYDVVQKEGWNAKETRRRYLFNQDGRTVRYKKNNQPEQTIRLNGKVYNEFASFFINRALDFEADEPLIIPTFADKKRHEVKVEAAAREPKQSIFGMVDTIKVVPKLKFKGLYDKEGDTVFWLTDDRCRVPVEIRSKLVVGSLTAKLVEYTNADCEKYTGSSEKTSGTGESQKR